MAVKTLTIVDACKDEHLFGPYFGGELDTWRRWLLVLRAIYGLPIRTSFGRKFIQQVTGRNPDKLNPNGYQTALILTGRRSGKSRMAAVIAAHSAALGGLEERLDPGETGLIAVVAPTRLQGRIVRNYIRSLYSSPMLEAEVIKERTEDTFTLRNGNKLEILASDYRSVRGFTLLGVVVDEIAFMGLEDSSKVRTDTQLIQSLQPALATTGGRLVAISSPYGKSGWAYTQFTKHFGNDASQDVLVVNAPSRVMNPTLPQSVVDRAKAEDLAAALSEYEGQFRDDVMGFISIEVLQNLVVKHRHESLYMPGNRYNAFVDLSGGRNDASALCIAHQDSTKKVIIDVLDWHPAPNNPFQVVATMAKRLREWNVTRVTGDAYSAEFASRAFQDSGISYTKCEKNKSLLYGELLPILSAGQIELLDNERSVKQLASLERRTRAGGRDSIDHPPRAHDDLANAIAGAAFLCTRKRLVVGAGGF